ncbi:hypothetical protein FC18_GL001281 [Lacticaseibacillus sharpeae JCM 1186 = DSM 20505]|uniref:Uncharacterized protein n=1 Tax=Lacticaseibacillus sharpeae JCM 1186 = DSM 20505 TaxID=1291052 RepID=A0A0R1ZQJ0_9LACO|nr:hypothetical protein FC18_GL001281 [Lacticaseibacillus sharpeae JCM 1186 = DSM 20505]
MRKNNTFTNTNEQLATKENGRKHYFAQMMVICKRMNTRKYWRFINVYAILSPVV